MEKMSRAERAKQFMPFAALRGYGKVIHEKEKVITEKRELTEEENDLLTQTVLTLKKGDVIKIKYYSVDGYITVIGAVSNLDLVLKTITIIKTRINFSDILSIEKEEQ